jgi:hypothetical protein
MMDAKTASSNGVALATAGAIGQTAPSKYIRTIVAIPVPPELQAAARSPDNTIEVLDSDVDVVVEANAATTKSELDRTASGVLQRRRRLVRRIAMAACAGLGLVAIAIAIPIVSRSAAHGASAPALALAMPGTPLAVPAVSVPAVASSSPPAAAPSASAATVAQSPAPLAAAKTPAPRTHPVRPKRAPAKTAR